MRIVVFVFFLILTPLSVYAVTDAPDYEVSIEKGKNLFNNGEYTEASEEFGSAVSARPDDPSANWWLGISNVKAKKYEKAIAALTKSAKDAEFSVNANYYLGIAYYQLGFFDDAKDAFESALALSTSEELKAYAREYIAGINKQKEITAEAGKPAKPLEISAVAGIQYDSNAMLSPDDERLVNAMRISKGASDWRTVMYLNGSYKFIDKKDLLLKAGYSVYQNFHKRHSSFNTNTQTASIFSKYSVDPLSVKAEYGYEYTILGGHRYSSVHALSSTVNITEQPGIFSEVTYAYHKNYYWDSHLAATNSQRRGHNHSIGVSQTVPLSSIINLTAGYSHDDELADREYWSYKGDKFSVSIDAVKNPWRLDLGMERYFRDYKAQDPVASTIRADLTKTYSVGITRALTPNIAVILMHDFIDSDSNIESYEYKREITSIFASISF